MITISTDHLHAIRAHGEQEFPDECCGVMLGSFSADGTKSTTDLMPITNAREEEARHNRFLITPEDMFRAEKAARAKGLDVIGFYHSHPDHPARPSQFDLDHAWPVYSYVIVSVMKGASADLTSWVLRADRSAFDAEEIEERGGS